MTTVAIIGSGLSGLTVAGLLKNHADVTLFEKSRGVGGRMATRRAKAYAFDHGAQFFKARGDAFRRFLEPMIAQGVVGDWNAHFVEFIDRKINQKRQWDSSYPHYVGLPNMNAIAKYLSQGLNINLGVRVSSIERDDHQQWRLADDQGTALGSYDWVVSTIPAQQASQVLPSWLTFYQEVNTTVMKGCFSLMLGFKNAIPLEFDAALVRGENISWISVNSAKPQRATPFCMLVHSTNAWADEHINDDRTSVMEYLCEQTSQIIGYNLNSADHKDVHGWHFANIGKQNGSTHFLDAEHRIGICGDWLIQGRVESAFVSGYTMANAIIASLNLTS